MGMDDQKKDSNQSEEDTKSPVEIGAKVIEPINKTPGNNAQGEIVDPNLVFDELEWKEAIMLHGKAADTNGVRRIVAAIDHAVADYGGALPKGSSSGTALLTEVCYGEIAREMSPCLETLLEVGVNINQEMIDRGRTLLFKTCGRGNVKLVERLLVAQADVNQRDYYGQTSLMKASKHDRVPVVTRLLALGAGVNEEDDEGRTSLMHACDWHGSVGVIDKLLSAGADVHHRNKDGDTIFISAIRMNCSREIVKRLLEAGANVNDVGECGSTSLAHACLYASIDHVEQLLAVKADVQQKDNYGKTALDGVWGHRTVCAWRRKKYALNLSRSVGKNGISAYMNIVGLLLKAGAKSEKID